MGNRRQPRLVPKDQKKPDPPPAPPKPKFKDAVAFVDCIHYWDRILTATEIQKQWVDHEHECPGAYVDEIPGFNPVNYLRLGPEQKMNDNIDVKFEVWRKEQLQNLRRIKRYHRFLKWMTIVATINIVAIILYFLFKR